MLAPTPGSQLKITSPSMDVAYDDYVANGRGTVNMVMSNEPVAKPIDMQVNLQNVKIASRESLKPLISGIGANIDLEAGSFSIEGGLKNTTLEFRLPNGNIPDIRELNTFLQGRAGFEFVSGKSNFSGVFEVDAGSGSGEFDISVKRVIANFKAVPLSADINIHVQVSDSDIKSSGFDVSGSYIYFDRVAVRDLSLEKHKEWWGRINLNRASVTFTKPLELDAEVAVEMYDTRPLLALFDKTATHRVLQRILTIKDIQGRAKVSSDKDSITFNSLKLTGRKLQLDARFRLSDKTNGIVYTRLRGIPAAMEIKGNKSKMIFRSPKKRFQAYPKF